VFLKGCQVYETLRGLRIQDCGGGVISDCETDKTIESGIYLAAGSYSGTDGSSDFKVSGNVVRRAFNNGYLVVGGARNQLIGNTAISCASAGIMLWSTLDCTVKGNALHSCNLLGYTGIGTDGDAFGQIVCDGNTNIGTGSYLASITGNSMLQCNIGRNSENVGINLRSSDYPTASNKCYLDSNIADVTLRVGSFPVLEQTIATTTTPNLCKVLTTNYPSTSSKGVLESQRDQLFLGTQDSHYELPTGLQADLRVHVRAGTKKITMYPNSSTSLWDVDATTVTSVSHKELPDLAAKSFYYQLSVNKWFYI
jgi:hypothetical protein